MPFYSRMYLYLLIDRVIHMTSDRLHEQTYEQQISQK